MYWLCWVRLGHLCCCDSRQRGVHRLSDLPVPAPVVLSKYSRASCEVGWSCRDPWVQLLQPKAASSLVRPLRATAQPQAAQARTQAQERELPDQTPRKELFPTVPQTWGHPQVRRQNMCLLADGFPLQLFDLTGAGREVESNRSTNTGEQSW